MSFRTTRRTFLDALSLPLLSTRAMAANQVSESGWQAGFARINITPEKPIPLAGYANRTAPFQSVTLDLYMKAMVLEDVQGGRRIVITADLVGFSAALSARICELIHAETGIQREAVLLNGSHTHHGPVLDAGGDDPLNDKGRGLVREYTDGLASKAAAIVKEALAGMRPARLSWGEGVAGFIINRRQPTSRGITLGVNPRGYADRTVPVLRVETTQGKIAGLLFGAACHGVTLEPELKINGDYAGYAQAYVEEKIPGVQAMFMIGCAGDVRPHPRGSLELARAHGRSLADEVCRVADGKLTPLNGPVRTELRFVDVPLQTFTREQIEKMKASGPDYTRFFSGGALRILNAGGKLRTSYPAPLAVWQFGKGLTLVAYSGETVGDYAPLAVRRLGPLDLWIAGYCNDVFGYLPSRRILAEGGYEARGLYEDIGLFAPSTEDVIGEAIADIARAAGRSMPSAGG